MEYKNLGNSGLKVSRICLGTMTLGKNTGETTQVGEKESIDLIRKALDSGVNFLDTADIYPIGNPGGSEEVLGKAVRDKRDSVVIGSKICAPTGQGPNDKGLSRKHIMKGIEDSLRRLQTDYLDLYYTHVPDYDTPMEETLRAFDDLIRQGKVRYIGASNFYAWYLAKALGISEFRNLARFICVQVPYNLLARDIEYEMMPLCNAEGIGMCTYNPLAGEMLTGRHEFGKPPAEGRFTLGDMGKMYQERYWSEMNFKAVDRLSKIAEEREISLPQFALAWILNNSKITTVLSGTISTEQLKENLAAVEIELSQEELQACDDVWNTFRPPRHFYAVPMEGK